MNISKLSLLSAVLSAVVLGGGSGYQASSYVNQVTPSKLEACANDEYVNLVATISMYRQMGVPKQTLQDGIDEKTRAMARKALEAVYEAKDLEKVGVTAYAECLNK